MQTKLSIMRIAVFSLSIILLRWHVDIMQKNKKSLKFTILFIVTWTDWKALSLTPSMPSWTHCNSIRLFYVARWKIWRRKFMKVGVQGVWFAIWDWNRAMTFFVRLWSLRELFRASFCALQSADQDFRTWSQVGQIGPWAYSALPCASDGSYYCYVHQHDFPAHATSLQRLHSSL